MGLAMKTTHTPFTMSELKTPNNNRVAIRGKTTDVTRLDVETFESGNLARLVFWLDNGSSVAIMIKTSIMRGIAPVDATER